MVSASRTAVVLKKATRYQPGFVNSNDSNPAWNPCRPMPPLRGLTERDTINVLFAYSPVSAPLLPACGLEIQYRPANKKQLIRARFRFLLIYHISTTLSIGSKT